MDNNLKKQNFSTIISIVMIIIAVILICYGIVSYLGKLKQEPNDNNNSKPEDNTPAKKIVLKDNEFLFNNYIYIFRDGWKKSDDSSSNLLKLSFDGVVDEIPTKMEAYISTQKISSTGHSKDELFSDPSYFEDILNKNNPSGVLGSHMSTTVGDEVPLIIFPYNDPDYGEILVGYISTYEGYYYEIKFNYIKTIDGSEVKYLSYDDLFKIANMVNSGVKAN